MYTAVMLFALSYLVEQPAVMTAFVWVILVIALVLKLHFEEGLLEKKFPNYSGYKSATKKLIPFVY